MFELHAEIVLQSMKYKKKLFNLETLKSCYYSGPQHMALRQISLLFIGQISPRAMG
jgi:hypothetical protein